jgi:integrase
VPPPKTHESEVEILDADQIATALSVLKGNRIYPIVALAIATGMRRGELLALRWQDVDLERGVISVERSLDEAFRIRNRNLNTVGGPYRYRCLLWNCYSTVRHS